jgi:hypothetical protein
MFSRILGAVHSLDHHFEQQVLFFKNQALECFNCSIVSHSTSVFDFLRRISFLGYEVPMTQFPTLVQAVHIVSNLLEFIIAIILSFLPSGLLSSLIFLREGREH